MIEKRLVPLAVILEHYAQSLMDGSGINFATMFGESADPMVSFSVSPENSISDQKSGKLFRLRTDDPRFAEEEAENVWC